MIVRPLADSGKSQRNRRGCTAAYGAENVGKYMGLHTCVSCMTGAVFSIVIGLLYDLFGSYVPFLCVAMLISAVSIICIARLNSLYPAQHE